MQTGFLLFDEVFQFVDLCVSLLALISRIVEQSMIVADLVVMLCKYEQTLRRPWMSRVQCRCM